MKRKKTLIPVLLIIITFVFLTRCMTSKGTLLEEVVSSDSSAPSEEDSYEGDQSPGLTIRTNPSSANIYIGDTYAGRSPLTELLSTGNYRVTAKIEGYYTTTQWVNYTEGEDVSLKIDLKPVTGFLNISVSPMEADVSTAGDTLHDGINELQIGKHTVKAKLFGYETWEEQLTIYQDKTTKLRIDMKPSNFNLSNLFINKKAFNPANPAGLGECKLSFDVSTYGTGELKIYSEKGEQILSNLYPYFDDWNQSFIWRGKDDYGKLMPDGTYRVVVSGQDMSGNHSTSIETFLTIDSSLIIRIRSTLNGVSGTLFSPTPEILPKESLQLSVSTFGHIDGENYRFPVSASLRVIPKKNMEITGQAGIVILPETSESFFLSASLKNILIKNSLSSFGSMSWYLKGSFQNNLYTDSQTNFTGLSAGLPMSLTFLPVTLVITPEIIVSPFKVSYTGITSDPGFYIWGYGRTALIIDIGSAMMAVSAAVRTAPFSEGIKTDTPLSAGIELNWLIPGTGIFITGIVSGEFSSYDNFYINTGGGIGLIN